LSKKCNGFWLSNDSQNYLHNAQKENTGREYVQSSCLACEKLVNSTDNKSKDVDTNDAGIRTEKFKDRARPVAGFRSGKAQSGSGGSRD
jgi:hypothetical protein